MATVPILILVIVIIIMIIIILVFAIRNDQIAWFLHQFVHISVLIVLFVVIVVIVVVVGWDLRMFGCCSWRRLCCSWFLLLNRCWFRIRIVIVNSILNELHLSLGSIQHRHYYHIILLLNNFPPPLLPILILILVSILPTPYIIIIHLTMYYG